MEHIFYQWVIYFYSPKKLRWWQRWFKKGFHHCGAIRYDPEKKIWINTEMIFSKIIIEVITRDEMMDMLDNVRRMNGRIVQLTVEEKDMQTTDCWIKEHTCVSFIQKLLGMRKWFIFTPYQLYCALNKS
jgi:hypothetical protein|tara:strand:+ start:875 stop:1261 length:387 start_codon:yes stop_codon:yes gene_type:complete